MKTRYYLRGLGLGILITAVFFLLGGKNDQTMSDEMIKQRARELGMVESTVLANIGENTKETEESSQEEEVVLETITDAVADATEEMTETESVDEASEELTDEELTTTEETTSDESEESETEVEKICIVVNSGERSGHVSYRLYSEGLIDDSDEFDLFMMQNGYDKKIRSGEHFIPVGSEFQEIAEILMQP